MHESEITKFKKPAVKIAMCNFMENPRDLSDFAQKHGFDGIDWSFDMAGIPQNPREESLWAKQIKSLTPLEIRYHCPFDRVDIGHEDPGQQRRAAALFRKIIRIVARTGGGYLTLHVGLGRDSTRILSWNTTIESLRDLVHYAADLNVHLCLENLAWGWTAKPNLFEKLIRYSGAGITFDIGHARACPAVQTQQYNPEDFLTPHKNRIYNAHVYHEEIEGKGHIPPSDIADIAQRLDLLMDAGCTWWTLEIREAEGLIQTRKIVDQYLTGPGAKKQTTTAAI
ncbi:MAG: sugar phosphate isomerase/epimerase [Desulfobacterales bacterium]|nr:sugar phosphate isomerase/epimerase [Desulfobacterales bacterium]